MLLAGQRWRGLILKVVFPFGPLRRARWEELERSGWLDGLQVNAWASEAMESGFWQGLIGPAGNSLRRAHWEELDRLWAA